MDQFRVFRAIGMSFKAWFANFIPFTILAGVLYAPVIIWVVGLPGSSAGEGGEDAYLKFFERGTYVLVGLSTLLAPMITQRVIQYLNGQKSSMLTSIKYGMRGILPALILAGVTNIVQLAPFGGILGAIITCYWFVAAPAAVVENLNPVTALSRSATLTQGRRWPIFGLCIMVTLIIIGVALIWAVPMLSKHDQSPSELLSSLKQMSIMLVVTICVFQLFTGIVQAVSYSLLRGDKDGVSNDELAKVFE